MNSDVEVSFRQLTAFSNLTSAGAFEVTIHAAAGTPRVDIVADSAILPKILTEVCTMDFSVSQSSL